ncbi:sigma-70 family RNA polymerase sigma factor [Nigerium massiliense]|uniref:sigma-70 family RNA polymerase sigma factor n=1 Tax=Nigerium massiliense TaxID=1522317 RepID=UPI00058FAA62|nr:sigma-70 family RNA polymerase sigma factor [Nigerium massiliense]
MPLTLDFTVPVPDARAEQRLTRAIEAGVLAAELRTSATAEPPPGVSVTVAELDALVREGERAWEQMVSANLRLVMLVLRSFDRRDDAEREELFQEGTLALMEALRRYDHRRGARFATFALPWIRTRIADSAATRCGALPMPTGRARARIRVHSAAAAMAVSLGRPPSAAEVAQEVGRPVDWVRGLLGYRAPVSLDALPDLDQSLPPAEQLPDELGLHRVLRRLPDDERTVVECLYGFGRLQLSCQQTADALAISTSTVRRRERSALDRLRRSAELAELSGTMVG